MSLTEIFKTIKIEDDFSHKENDKGNVILISPEGDKLKFYKTKKDLADQVAFERFVSACEKGVRSDPRYTAYKASLLEQGFNRCAFYGKIDTNKVTLEMHHGPMFNLFEIISIITDHMLSEWNLVCTMDVVDEVLTAHELKLVQTIMLTETAHQMVHDGDIFTHYHQAFGDIMGFIKRYKNGFKKEHCHTMKTYLSYCELNNATDNDMLKAVRKIKKRTA